MIFHYERTTIYDVLLLFFSLNTFFYDWSLIENAMLLVVMQLSDNLHNTSVYTVRTSPYFRDTIRGFN